MTQKYKIPLQYQTGKYLFSELPEMNGTCLVLSPDVGAVLKYTDPVYQNEIKVYSVPKEDAAHKLRACYDENGILEYVEVANENFVHLVYIRFEDDEAAKETIFQFASYQADKIAEKLLKSNQTYARIFVEYFFDGQSADIAVRTGTPEEMQEIKEYYQKNHPRIAQKVTIEDNAGDFPIENRIEFDNDTLSIMLKCVRDSFREELFRFAVWILEQKIQEILPELEKTEDFKFISEEYD